jgi:hypothetical protein
MVLPCTLSEIPRMKLKPEDLGALQIVSRKEAAQQQIDMAIRLLHERHFACSITLALAAEGQMPEGRDASVFRRIAELAPDKVDEFNKLRNWLKHNSPPDQHAIYELEVSIALLRATSKFWQTYRDTSPSMLAFAQFWEKKGIKLGG